MLGWIRHNLGYKLMALAMSLGLWAYVHVEEGQLQRSINDVIELRNLPANLIPRLPTSQVRVTVEGPANRLESLTSDDVDSWVDLKGARQGVQRISVKCEMNRDTDVLSCRVSPGVLTVRLEPRVMKSVPIQVLMTGAPPLGFVFEKPQSVPTTATVSGVKTDVDRVSQLVAPLPAKELKTGQELDQYISLIPLDKRGAPVKGVQVQPDQARIVSTLHLELASKRLIVNPILRGSAAPGYKITNVTAAPRFVLAQGNAATLSNLSGVHTRSLVVSDIQLSRSLSSVSLETLPGIHFIPETVSVHIAVQPLLGPPIHRRARLPASPSPEVRPPAETPSITGPPSPSPAAPATGATTGAATGSTGTAETPPAVKGGKEAAHG